MIRQLKDGFDDSIHDREEVHLRKMQNFEREKNKGLLLLLLRGFMSTYHKN